MRNWKLKIAGILILGPTLWFAISALTDTTVDEARYAQLVSARRFEGRFMMWQIKMPWYRQLSKTTGFDPVSHYQKKAEALEESLRKSGALVGVGFYSPVRFYPAQGPEAQYVKLSSSEDYVSMLCRPRDVAYWQGTFCRITNRVSWGKLRTLGGNREEIMCILPDGQTVELSDGQRWLNESIESGWMVGVCVSNRFLIALRRKPGG